MMNVNLEKHIDLLVKRYPALEDIRRSIEAAYECMERSFMGGGKLLIAGNGGSAADCEHIAGELMKGFKLRRELSPKEKDALCSVDPELGALLSEKLQGALPCISLVNHPALNTAFLNDVDGLFCFAQQVYGYTRKGDVFLGISTSGNSKNILYAAAAAKAKGATTIAFTGKSGGKLAELCELSVKLPENETYMIQEYCLPVYHCWCLMLEDKFFGGIS